MTQAIVTKYIGPTDTKGSRIKATCSSGSLTIPYPHELSGDDVHRKAAETLVAKMGWMGYENMLVGGMPDGGCVFVADLACNRK